MKAYRKLIAAIVGLLVMLAHRHIGLDLSGQEAAMVDIIVAALTAAGVFGFKNEPTTT